MQVNPLLERGLHCKERIWSHDEKGRQKHFDRAVSPGYYFILDIKLRKNDKFPHFDNIFMEFGGRIFRQTIGIPMGTNCTSLFSDLFLYSYEAEFVQSLLQAGKKHLAQQFNFTYRYIDDVLSLKNAKFAEYLEFIYPRELEIKETPETAASSSYLDCYLYIDNRKLTSRLYDKRSVQFSHC